MLDMEVPGNRNEAPQTKRRYILNKENDARNANNNAAEFGDAGHANNDDAEFGI